MGFLTRAFFVVCATVFPFLANAQCQDPTNEPGRFSIRGIEVVDTKTRLVWLRCPAGWVDPRGECDGSAPLPAETYEFALTRPAGLFVPPGPWRLPSIEELDGIVAKDCRHLVNPNYIEVILDSLWSSSPASGELVWRMEKGGRRVERQKARDGEFSQAIYVRPARPEDLAPAARGPALARKAPVARGDVVLRVNGKPITAAEVQIATGAQGAAMLSPLAPDSDATRQAMLRLIDQELAAQAAPIRLDAVMGAYRNLARQNLAERDAERAWVAAETRRVLALAFRGDLAALRAKARWQVSPLFELPPLPTAPPAPGALVIRQERIEGLPVKLGDTVSEVQAGLQTALKPQPTGLFPGGSMLRAQALGIWVFFDAQGKARTIRLEAPFKGRVAGVGIGDALASVKAQLGEPSRGVQRIGTFESVTYAPEDGYTARFLLDASGNVQTIALDTALAYLPNPLPAKPRPSQFEDGMVAYKRNDFAAAFKLWVVLAEQGSAGAQHNVGVLYESGRGVPKDEEEAASWYRKAAVQNLASAQAALGILYAIGRGVEKDDAEAVRWYRRAADQGNARAQVRLGFMIANGRGTSKDEAEALHWYRMAAKQGDAQAQKYLKDLGESW